VTDQHDLHDANVDAAWRAHMRETPPPAVDDAIRAAAHRAVQSGPRSTEAPHRPRHRAWVPLAIAATLGVIAFGVVELAPHEGDALRDSVSDAPVVRARKQDAVPAQPAKPAAGQSAAAQSEVAQRAAEPPPRAREETPAPRSAATEAKQEPAASISQTESKPQDLRNRATPPARFAQRKDAETRAVTAPPPPPQVALDRQAFPAAPPAEKRESPPPRVAAPAPAPPPPAKDIASAPREVDAVGKLQKESAAADKSSAGTPPAARSAANAAAPAPSAAAPGSRDTALGQASGTLRAETARAKVATNRTPDDFVREIRRLRAEGRDADAALALAAFRAAYDDADARLPEDLREWSRSVARP